jgi:uncharacterized membrane protein YbhN (UPF0104 family)
VALAVAAFALVAATFAWFLPRFADYGAVWAAITAMSTTWLVVLLLATALNVATFAPPWQVALPGLRFLRALEVTQASTALSIVLPGGMAVSTAAGFGMLRRGGFATADVARAMTLVSVWNQFLNLLFPVLAVFLLALRGEQTPALATGAFIGAAAFGVIVTGFVVALVSDRLARELGDLAARVSNAALRRLRRGPVTWDGADLERFRDGAGDLVRRRWAALTVASLAGSLSVFLVLVLALRAVDVHADQVSVAEAFAAWALVRLLATVPITPGDIGVIELGLTTALVGFGGASAGVVAAVLVYRVLTVLPTIVIGLVAGGTWERRRRRAERDALRSPAGGRA